jgi:hypothetical protein
VTAVCCQAQVSAKGHSLVERSATECGVPPLIVILKPEQ